MSETLGSIRWASPLAWFSVSDPLARGGELSASGTAGLVVLGVVLIVLSALAFARRDLGQPLVVARRRRKGSAGPRGAGWYRHALLGPLYERRVALTWWVVAVVAEVVFFVALAPSIVQALDGVPQLHAYLVRIIDGDIAAGLVGLFLIGTVQLLLALFAISAVAGWARDDASGRLELDLSLPLGRPGVVRRRAAALLASSAGIAVTALGAMFVLAAGRGIEFDRGRVVLAALLLVPFTAAFGAIGALWTSWRPQGAVFILTGVAVVSYFIQEVAPLYGWPDWVLDVSFFHLYGNPLVGDASPWRIAVLVSFCVLGFAGAARMSRTRDVGR
ncbi:MAG: hypothetical protein ACRDJ4_10380 [Actinomycetota bacterium]